MKETILRGVGVFALALLGGLLGAGLFSLTGIFGEFKEMLSGTELRIGHRKFEHCNLMLVEQLVTHLSIDAG